MVRACEKESSSYALIKFVVNSFKRSSEHTTSICFGAIAANERGHILRMSTLFAVHYFPFFCPILFFWYIGFLGESMHVSCLLNGFNQNLSGVINKRRKKVGLDPITLRILPLNGVVRFLDDLIPELPFAT
ncbi:hypothetical protein SAY86_031503 [Trapa natans]|uniref:Uncharacterized protein n=1 Tax=Trapa natans TaxID=22666 RepID=A0AAN7R7H9_TRANT|nr:hypothetical protein SAY86_031503 [Trapa natans]